MRRNLAQQLDAGAELVIQIHEPNERTGYELNPNNAMTR
jgi:hypothetical protein